jgi:diguanylate cyclase (GGDEF)-like protein/PAS domain S-box-containing protein
MTIAGGAGRPSRAGPPADQDRFNYRVLFESGPKLAWVYALADGRILEVNTAACERYGYTRDEFLQLRIGDLRVGELTDALPTAERVERHVTKTGDTFELKIDGASVPFAGELARIEIAEDVSVDLQIDAALRDSEAQFHEAQELARIGSWKWDVATDLISWSPELCRIFGVDPDDAPTHLAAFLEKIHADDRAAVGVNVQRALDTLSPYEAMYRILLPSGDVRWLRCRGRSLSDERGRPLRMMGVCQDITEQKLAEDDLKSLALHDSLTGLPERALFIDRLKQSLLRLDRRVSNLAVVFLDLDRFKAINDKWGHAAGDEVLRTTSQRLARILRPGDTIARFGGDEFAILLEDVTHETALEVSTRLVAALDVPVIVDGRQLTATASIGIALTADATKSADELIDDADTAMYEAKNRGRNCFVVFDDSSRLRGLDRMRRSEELERAVDNDELRLFYQPDIDITTDTTVGVEALARWQHPTLGLVGPDEFIAVAEETGVVVGLGEWVLETACTTAASWPTPAQGGPLVVAVNISARQLAEPTLAGFVRRVLHATGLAPERLCLEITESVLMDDVRASVKALLDLKTLGVQLAIDDFGTGYSSLSYLRRFPVDVVKIDRTFVAGVGVDPAADAIVAAVINLSHALGLSVVAEGVETEEQLVAIRALGCDRAQGFYWSQSLPADELNRWTAIGPQSKAGYEEVDLRELLAERAEALRTTTGRSVLVEAPMRLASLVAERRALKTIIDHLLGNAVTYSPSDRPVVIGGASDRHWVRITIADYGIGMTGEEAARCFEQFWQAQVQQVSLPRGTGMGLYIVRSLVESMGGHIGVKSAKGKGTTFTVALPRARRAIRRPPVGPPGPASLGEDTSIREFMRQIGVPNRRGA